MPHAPTTLSCPACGAPVEPEEGSDVARCRFCRAVVRVPRPAGGGGVAAGGGRRPDVPMPARIRVEESPRGFRIVRAWWTPAVLFLVPFLVVWFGILAVFYGFSAAAHAPWFFFAFPLIHVAVGLGLGYFALTGILNRTTIAAEDGTLVVRHHPLPWPGGGTYDASELSQVYVEERISHGKHGSVHRSYRVLALRRAGGTVKLLSGLPDVEQALFVEQELERRLSIHDRPVPGELPNNRV